MRSNALPGFTPSIHGFRFANRWPAGPAFELRVGYLRVGLGEVSDGLCGGMCFAAADRYVRGEAAPDGVDAPARGTPLFGEIARRQLDSFDRLAVAPARFLSTSARLARGWWHPRDQVRELRAVLADINAGRPAMVGLVRAVGIDPFGLTANHVVVGYTYEVEARHGRLGIYDPNHPGRDDVTLTIQVATAVGAAGDLPSVSLTQSTGEPLLALLRLPYRPARRPASD